MDISNLQRKSRRMWCRPELRQRLRGSARVPSRIQSEWVRTDCARIPGGGTGYCRLSAGQKDRRCESAHPTYERDTSISAQSVVSRQVVPLGKKKLSKDNRVSSYTRTAGAAGHFIPTYRCADEVSRSDPTDFFIRSTPGGTLLIPTTPWPTVPHGTGRAPMLLCIDVGGSQGGRGPLGDPAAGS